ncbi:MAG: CAP domain-containing protein [Chitinophagales bacterium]
MFRKDSLPTMFMRFPQFIALCAMVIGTQQLHAQLNSYDNPFNGIASSLCPEGSESTPQVDEEFELQLVELINVTRDAAGVPPLKFVPNLCLSARYHAKDMCDNDYFAHNSQDASGNSTCNTFDRIGAFYSWNGAGENIAAGTFTVAETHDLLVNSPGHYANIIHDGFREIGVGYWQDASAMYTTRWVENFGKKSNVYPLIINKEFRETDSLSVELYVYGSGIFDEMRLRNEDGEWTEWMPFAAETTWNLTPLVGTRTVHIELKNLSGTQTASSSDAISLTQVPDFIPEEPTDSLEIETPVPQPDSSVVVSVKTFLQGAYDMNSNLMTTHLCVEELLPDNQPYSAAPWNYAGTEQIAVSQMPTNTVDWVLVELRDANDPTIVVAQKAALLMDYGGVVDIDLSTDGVWFYNIDVQQSYYLVIRHRNHLDLMSANTVTLPNADSYDFTHPAEVLGGATQLAHIGENIYGMHSGDIDGNGNITVSDFNIFKGEASLFGAYLLSDCNLDEAATINDYNWYQTNASVIGESVIRIED